MRIEQNHTFLIQLASQVQAGQLAPAGMQRDYEWSRKDVEDFADSIQDGLPIGAFVTWRPHSDTPMHSIAKSRLGPIRMEAEGDYRELILDGQHRLGTLAWMAGGEPPEDPSEDERKVWMSGTEMYLSAETGRIRFMSAKDADRSLCMSARSLIDLKEAPREMRRRYNAWEAAGIPEGEINKFLDLHQATQEAFLRAKVNQTSIQNATIDEARSVFLRVCKTGVPMSAEDFDRAVNWQPASAAAPK
jgi:hypothetical protein